MDFGAIGWREGVIAAIVVVAAYIAFTLWRLVRVSRARSAQVTWKQDPVQFGEQQFMRGVQDELQQLRTELGALREEVERLKASRNVSPQYNEAVALAQQGMDAQTIAERCGIAVAEAELVRALSRGGAHEGET